MSFTARLRRTIASVGTGAVVLVGASTGVVLMAGVASAHTPSVSADCHGLSVTLASYNANEGGTNTVTIDVDGSTLVDHQQFASSYSDSVPWTTYAAHAWSVAVFAFDDPTGANGWTKTFSGTSTPCTTEAHSTAPSFTDPSCQSNLGHVTIPAVTGAQYAINGTDVGSGDHTFAAGSSVTVTVRATSAQYTLTGDTGPWSHTFGSTPDCTTHVTPVTPSVSQGECTGPGQQSNGSITLPDQTGVIYEIDGVVQSGTVSLAPGTYHVTAVPASAAYTLDGTTSWDLTIDQAGCSVHVTPVTPSASQASCDGTPGGLTSGAITIPATTGVDYQLDGNPVSAGTYAEPPGTYTVTAAPQQGYTFGESTAEWMLSIDANPECSTDVSPAAPSVSQFICTKTTDAATLTGPTYTIPDTTGVDYLVGGDVVPAGTYDASPGVLHIVAVAQPGFTFPAGTTSSWDLTIHKAPTCVLGEKFHRSPPPQIPPPAQVLPFTGTPLPIAQTILVALLALGAGAALTLAGRRRGRFAETD